MTRLFPLTIAAAMTLAAASLCAAPPLAEAKSRAEVVTHFDRRSDLRVLNVWATWCAPCVAEMPELQKIHEAYGRRGVSLVALSMDDVLPGSREEARERVESFVASRSLSFPTLLYIGSIPEIETEFNLSGEIPVTIVFDRKGREVKRIEGILDGPSFRAELDRLLAVDTANAN